MTGDVETPKALEIFGVPPAPGSTIPKYFHLVEAGHYQLDVAAHRLHFNVDRLRRERSELIGELAVRCDIPGVGFDGVISVGDFNLSGVVSRSARAKILRERSNLRDVDWGALLEELCQRVLGAERAGRPAISLRDLPAPRAEQEWELDGIDLLSRHPQILFGDGGSAKSYLALWILGKLSRCGVNVALFDWELAPDEHRGRLERLFGHDMPDVRYVRCERPLVHEIDGLKRVVRDEKIEFAVFDSIAFACDGPPEAAEIAGEYFRAVRQMGPIGTLHIAHINKSGDGSEMKPFGSTFWHNGARSTWYVTLGEPLMSGGQVMNVFPRKCNLGPRKPEFHYTITFERGRTIIEGR